jgi:glycine/D-amino acid oxidase-like deaminating enzyme/nitrite reductase/ring-hydroxylating ferredoxin subunit
MAQRVAAPESTKSYWLDSAPLPRFGKLDRDGTVDVVVVGGGITGLTAAYLLAVAGKKVAVLERDRCARVDTGHTTAHLTMVTDAPLVELVKRYGRDHAQAVWDAGLAAIAQIDAHVRELEIDCAFEWVEGYWHDPAGEGSDDPGYFAEEVELARELGFDAEVVTEVPLVGGAGGRFDGQARFHPRRYLAGLLRALDQRGARIYEHSAATEFESEPLQVRANGCTLMCEDIVVATHNPLVGVSDMKSASALQMKLALYSTYVVAGRVPRGVVPDALFWDTADPYHYLRVEPHRTHDLVIFGGEDHKTGQVDSTEEHYARLTSTVLSLIPEIELTHRWSGQVIETADRLPFIGRTAEHQYAATGFSGNGMTFGTLGAMIAADAILGRKNPWSELFDPERSVLRHGAWNYLRENVDYPYYKTRDRFAGAEARSLRAVKRGTGRVIERNGAQVAAFRDRDGAIVLRSAACTHMGCTVRWNDAERSWDCPCHGSRFRPDGGVISGPAESPLEKAE